MHFLGLQITNFHALLCAASATLVFKRLGVLLTFLVPVGPYSSCFFNPSVFEKTEKSQQNVEWSTIIRGTPGQIYTRVIREQKKEKHLKQFSTS